jgi:hypothetical protein
MSADFVEPKPLHKLPMKSGRDILDAQYKSGRAIVDRSDWARLAYESLRKRCPHVPEEELVRLFHDRGQSQLELITGDAIFREYNASRPLGRRRTKRNRRNGGSSAPKAKAAARPKEARKPKLAKRPAARKATVKPKRRKR